MKTVWDFLNSREQAIILCSGLALLWVSLQRQLHPAVGNVLRAALHPRLSIPFGLMLAWVLIEVRVAASILPWTAGLSKTAVVWFLTTGVLLFGRLEEPTKNPHYFREKVIETLTLPAILGFYLDLYHFPVLAELGMLVAGSLVALVSVLASRAEHLAPVRRVANGLLASLGLTSVGYVTYRTVGEWGAMDKIGLMVEFALSAGLTVGLIPFVYFLTLFAHYESMFKRLEFRSEASWTHRLRCRVALFAGLRLRIPEVAGIGWDWLIRVREAETFEAACAIIRQYRARRAEIAIRRCEESDRLRRFAGVDGSDSQGFRLDRREFRETLRALEWVATCMHSSYHRRERYAADLMATLRGSSAFSDLPEPNGLEIEVSEDGQVWYAWRRAIPGWCFAIGGSRGRAETWRMDSAQPPSGFPGLHGCWGNSPGQFDAAPNWAYEERLAELVAE
ncbi:MAG: hypothetical protein IPK72_23735 [Candidatus Eisenbacteria bacterium]|nr:hypothetical protein [Candidatus Eisenbacteria bacterium]